MRRPAIVIVTCNSGKEIGACLAAASTFDADLVVVDNASRDNTVDAVRLLGEVQLITNSRNEGFAAGVNQGIAAVDNELVLLLNPDVVLQCGLDEMVREFADPSVGAVSGRLVGEDGRWQTGFAVRRFPTPATLVFEALGWNRLWPGNPVNRRYRRLDFDPEKPADIEQPAGAFVMLRRSVWEDLDGLDESFFPIWFEDVDFLLRMRRRGLRICYLPTVTARHRGGHSIRQLSDRCRQLYWYGSLLRYASKHFGPLGRRVVCLAVVIGSLLRMLVSTTLERSLNPVLAFGSVVRLAGEFLLTGRIRGARRFAAAGTIT